MDTTLPFNPPGEAAPLEAQSVVALRAALAGVMHVDQVSVPVAPDEVVQFKGRLALPSAQAFRLIRDRFREMGYTAFLRRSQAMDGVQAVKGALHAGRSRVWINVVLLILSVITVLLSATIFQVYRHLATAGFNAASPNLFGTALSAIWHHPGLLVEGVPFAATLLLILGVHEMGHYVAARVHRAEVTLPYFLPFPPLGGLSLGTLGAFVRLRSPIEDRRALFDIGVSGPLAGLAVAAPLFVVGIALSTPHPASPHLAGGLGLWPLVTWIVGWIQPETFRPDIQLELHPIAIAAWFGLLLTMLNLMPIGSLDGGHVMYALAGQRAFIVSVAALAGLIALGVAAWTGWLLWAFVAALFGLRHPPPLNDVTPLDRKRHMLSFASLAIFFLLFAPIPFV